MSKFKTIPLLLWCSAFILVGWILCQLPLSTLSASLSHLSIKQWLAWIGLNLGIILIATQRWLSLLKGLNLGIPFRHLLLLRQAGQAISFITPGPQFGGEPLQIYWLWKRQHWPIHSALLGLGVDRFYELWVNFGVLLISVVLLMIPSINSLPPATLALNGPAVFFALLLLLLSLSLLGGVILKHPDRVLGWLKRATHYWQHHPCLINLETHWHGLSSDLKQLMTAHKLALVSAFMWSLLGWVGLIGELGLILSFFDLGLTASQFMMIFMAMRLAFLLPLPGGIGTLEASLFWVFQNLDLPMTAVMSVIALMRLRDVLTLLIGLGCVRGLRVGD